MRGERLLAAPKGFLSPRDGSTGLERSSSAVPLPEKGRRPGLSYLPHPSDRDLGSHRQRPVPSARGGTRWDPTSIAARPRSAERLGKKCNVSLAVYAQHSRYGVVNTLSKHCCLRAWPTSRPGSAPTQRCVLSPTSQPPPPRGEGYSWKRAAAVCGRAAPRFVYCSNPFAYLEPKLAQASTIPAETY